MKKNKIIAICNQKGGVGKTTTAITLSAALTAKGKRVLLVDCDDSNPTLTKALVSKDPSSLPSTLVDLMLFTMLDRSIADELTKAIHHHNEGFDVLPATAKLAGITMNLNVQQDNELKNRCLAAVLAQIKSDYDYIIIDAAPALNTLSVNIMAATDEVIIITQAQDAAEEGIAELIGTVSNVRRTINPDIIIKGLLITMEDNRTNYSKQTSAKIQNDYTALGMKVFCSHIPRAVKAEEFMRSGQSLLAYAPKGKVTDAYLAFADEFLQAEEAVTI